MPNWSKKLIAGSRRDALLEMQREHERLEQLLARFSGERHAIDTMLTTLTERTDELRPLAKSLDDVAQEATTLSARVAEISSAMKSLDHRATALEASEHVQWIKDAFALMRKGIQEVHTRHAEIGRVNESLETNRRQLEEFDQHLTDLVARVPELEGRVNAILSKLAQANEAVEKATAITRKDVP